MSERAEGQTWLIPAAAGVVWLSGEDRLSFLERMSTNRLTDLSPGAGRATAVLSDVGRVVDLVGCYAGAEGAALVTSTVGAAAAVAQHLKRYVLRDRVRVTDATQQVDVLRLVGSEALSIALEATALERAPAQPGAWIESGAGPSTVWLMRHPLPSEGGLGGCDVIVPTGESSASMAARLIECGASDAQPSVAVSARVRAGIPAYGAEIDGSTNPLELGLRGVVDFAKGCYIGQEVVARLDTYEKVQRRLLRIGFADTVKPSPHSGEPIGLGAPATGSAGRRGGRLTSVATEGEGRGQALALVPTAWAHAQADLVLGRDGQGITLERLAVVGDA
jgi:folate-binding protein YgfZ